MSNPHALRQGHEPGQQPQTAEVDYAYEGDGRKIGAQGSGQRCASKETARSIVGVHWMGGIQ